MTCSNCETEIFGSFCSAFTEADVGKNDVEAHKGILITQEGYSRGAINRGDCDYLICIFFLSRLISQIWNDNEVLTKRIIGGSNG